MPPDALPPTCSNMAPTASYSLRRAVSYQLSLMKMRSSFFEQCARRLAMTSCSCAVLAPMTLVTLVN